MKRLARLVRCAPALVILATLCATPAMAATPSPSPTPTIASGSLGIQLLNGPLEASTDPRALVYIVDHLAPGSVIHRRLAVSNTTDSAMHVVLFSAAATIANGAFIGAAGRTPNPLSTWTTVRPGATNLPAGGRAIVAVTIAVPHSAAGGEQYGVVWAEVRSAPSSADGITEISRVGIRIYLSVGPGGAPASDFTINTLTAERAPDGQPMVLAAVHNTGGLALDMSGTLRLVSGPGGLSAGPFPASLGTTLAIGGTEPVTILLSKQLPAGPWDARITLRSGLLAHSARATITFPKPGAAPLVFTTSTRSDPRNMAIIVAFVLLVVAAICLLVTVRRRPT